MYKLLQGLPLPWNLHQQAISQGEKDKNCQGLNF